MCTEYTYLQTFYEVISLTYHHRTESTFHNVLFNMAEASRGIIRTLPEGVSPDRALNIENSVS
jgi:hypothetical protein